MVLGDIDACFDLFVVGVDVLGDQVVVGDYVGGLVVV